MASEDLARRRLPGLRRNLAALTDLSARVFASAVNIRRRSHLRFMLASFAVKQIEHSRSILKLDQSIDTVLVARSMLEGLCHLLWALKLPRRRPLMWRTFVFVLDWRLLRQHQSEGKTVDRALQRHTRLGLHRYGRWFLSKEAREALARGRRLPKDPYARLVWRAGGRNIPRCWRTAALRTSLRTVLRMAPLAAGCLRQAALLR